MSRRKTERQLNLVICLLATRRFLTAQEIRATVSGYEEADSDAAFKRMFERDKKELRATGIPIQTGAVDVWGDEEGYRISRADYELPPIELKPDEAAVLGLAARAWRNAALGEAAANAMVKLRAAGISVDGDTGPIIAPVVGTTEPAFLPIWQAVRDRRPVTFDYRTPGKGVRRRKVEPWGVVNRRGHWYLAGHDRDVVQRRVFRLGRIVGPVTILGTGPEVTIPDDVDVRSIVSGHHGDPEAVALLRVRPDSAHQLRRAARRIVPGEHSTNAPGWDRVEYPYTDLARLVADVAEFGDRVIIDAPAEARTALADHLSAVTEREIPSPGEPAVPAVAPEDQPRRGVRSAEQLRRLLMLVPYALHRDVRVAEVADMFDLTEKQVRSDLSLLWMCGLPGYTPGDLIEVDLEAAQTTGEIIIGNAETIATPLRLTADEAASLIVGVELLRELQAGTGGDDVLKRVADKLRTAADTAVERLADVVRVGVDLSDEVRAVQRRVQDALEAGQLLHLRYLSGYVDEVTERDVDPMRLITQDGLPFLEGWCRLRGDVRLFRLDRILDLTVLPVAAEVPEHARGRDLTGGVLQFTAEDALVTLELSPAARWVIEEYVCVDVSELSDGGVRATLRTPAPSWARRLVLRLGPTARILAPTDLAERVRADAQRALAAYRAAASHD
ncbi:helix-turn-helix transcriptional regulator [Salinactinospora qingdaonensis]|uniref:Transcriptional regulator n=1 Tax=Salinactinospora qingdaonensis TaxID=702744 RepID=A0ABP7F114_9ACTN